MPDKKTSPEPWGGITPRLCRGTVSILAVMLLAVLATLTVSFAQFTNLNLRKGDNFRKAMDARLTAESGLEFMLYQLRRVRLPGDTTDTTLLANLTAALGDRLDGTPNLAGITVTNTGSAACVPPVQLEEGRTFCCWITPVASGLCRLKVKGSAGGLDRYLTMDLALSPKLPLVFNYGLASRGMIEVSGHTKIVGVNYPTEANVFSASAGGTAIQVKGSGVTISGDLFVSGEESAVAITGSPRIAGSCDPATVSEHIHFGAEPPDFPELNTEPLAALATNVVDSSTDMSSGQTFSNIRIAAGTNPNFTSDTVINGVVYVEAPNIVTFSGHATINGLIVTEDKDLPVDQCQLHFTGTLDAAGVEALPDTEEFAAVKQQTGTFVLAPGFAATFSGNFSTVYGSIMADQLTFSGTAEGVINGGVIGLTDLPTELAGNVEIYVDRSDQDPDPAGIVKPIALETVPDSYTELTGE